MIVNIAACLCVLNGAVGVWSLFAGPFGMRATAADFFTLLLSALSIAMGVGLLKRLPWGRWFALGASFLGWTLGSLLVLACVGLYFTLGTVFGTFTRGASPFGFRVLLAFALMVAGIVISFKLFFHLRSEEGAAEFGVEPDSVGTVVASVGAWMALFVTQWAFLFGGLYMRNSSNRADMAQYEAEQKVRRERDRALEERRAASEAQERARLEAERPEYEEDSPEEDEAPDDADRAEEAPAVQYQPIDLSQEPEEEVSSRNHILKCRDASGAMQYTQGYCPPGTKRVD